MADQKLVDLTADTSPTADDLFYMVNDPSGTPGDRKVTFANVIKNTPGRLIGVQYITTTGAYTYTPTSGTNSVVIELLGAGGGGGGVANASGSNYNNGLGGVSGGWLRKRLTANFSGATGSVGVKGSGGAAGANTGGTGGDTTFTDTAGSPTTYTAKGGVGGPSIGPVAAPVLCIPLPTPVSTTGGDDNVTGVPGTVAIASNISNGISGSGGHSRYGSGGLAVTVQAGNLSVAGVAATGKGAGGGGAVCLGTGGARAGGDGTDGLVIIWEYS